MFDQNEVVLVPFPFSDLTGTKQRPALVISNDKVNKSEDRICCLITSNAPKDGVLVSSTALRQGSLPFKSWVKPQRIFTVSQRLIRKRICTVSNEFHEDILAKLAGYLKRL
ncbi:type II toxin-antitoxin system PemK/MazF family toxin [Candidatus Micrarchaeota archaeon]|nr:type II toxin-antitoxin system PemK/MazF family toxin [Candidatus Micrarchaeota archaeon]